MTMENKQYFNFVRTKDVDLIITEDEKLRIISFIKFLQDKLNINNLRYDISKINKPNLDQFIVKGFNAEKIINIDKKLSNEFTLSLPGYFEEHLKTMGNAHVKIINIFSSKTDKNKTNVLKNNITPVNAEILANGIYAVLKRNGIKKIDIKINVYYSMQIQNLYYEFDVKSIGTSVFEKENTNFSERKRFTITEFELEKYIVNKKAMVKDFLYDFDFMGLKIFDKKAVLKDFKEVVEQLKLINY